MKTKTYVKFPKLTKALFFQSLLRKNTTSTSVRIKKESIRRIDINKMQNLQMESHRRDHLLNIPSLHCFLVTQEYCMI